MNVYNLRISATNFNIEFVTDDTSQQKNNFIKVILKIRNCAL